MLRIMEKHFNSLFGFFGYPEHKWPENDRDMKKWCRFVLNSHVFKSSL